MTRGGKTLATGFGNRPFIPFIGREQFVGSSQRPEAMALAAMVLASMGRPPLYWPNGREYDETDLRYPRVPVNPGALDVDMLRVITRTSPGRRRRTLAQPMAGLSASVLEQRGHVQAIGNTYGVLGRAMVGKLNVFSNFVHRREQPSFADLDEVLPRLGTEAAAWVDVRGGLPEHGLGARGDLSFLILGGNGEKLKLHTPGTAELEGVDGLYLEPEQLLSTQPALLTIAEWRDGSENHTENI